MKQACLVFPVLMFAVVQGYAIHPEAVKSHRAQIAHALANPNQENIVVLGDLLLGSAAYLDKNDSVAVEVHQEIQAALLAIPGHAEYYRDRILEAQVRFKNPGGGTTWSEYRRAVGSAFQVFPHLHSPEGVRVLGELFPNDWVPPGNENAVASEKFAPLQVSARVALQKFPLVDKPFKEPITHYNVADANAAWQLWYEQIKSGKRTFRFEGDPTEYDLNGPAPGQKLAHIARDRKRDAERLAGQERTSKSSISPEAAAASKPSKLRSVALIIAGMILLVSLGWYFLRGRTREVS